ncbi:sel1 repeat family protein [Shewanella surugensis]|uniref:Sel1 repeat family protein n=2 Tax=Shewanella surugensis TaxID=212020 RepID=A0ABT0LGD3_9GAMM|nr:tetratricopeptide repeat protein [Shewanella surugensis]MCL1126231.1 sel1 repeat family protein [Shewanella surugensis]
MAVEIYSQERLLYLIRHQQYLQQVKRDNCQLVQDIEARANVLKQPLYQFLWGEMLNYGQCVKRDPKRGIALLRSAANQGCSEAMMKMAEYYQMGQFVIQDKSRAVNYLLPAAASGDLSARLSLVRLLSEGVGSPVDYELAFHWLYNAVFNDEAEKKQALQLLKLLEKRMPPSVVARAKKQT